MVDGRRRKNAAARGREGNFLREGGGEERKNDGMETSPHEDGRGTFWERRRDGKKKRRRRNAAAQGRRGTF